VRSIIKASSDVKINTYKEEGGTVCMHVPDYSSVIYVTTDVCYGGEGCGNISGVVYSKK